jgi:hypothetical protein
MSDQAWQVLAAEPAMEQLKDLADRQPWALARLIVALDRIALEGRITGIYIGEASGHNIYLVGSLSDPSALVAVTDKSKTIIVLGIVEDGESDPAKFMEIVRERL